MTYTFDNINTIEDRQKIYQKIFKEEIYGRVGEYIKSNYMHKIDQNLYIGLGKIIRNNLRHAASEVIDVDSIDITYEYNDVLRRIYIYVSFNDTLKHCYNFSFNVTV